MARKPRRLHIVDRDPSFHEIAQRLANELHMKGIDHGPDRDAEGIEDRNGGVITIPYGAFYSIAGCKQLRKRLYTEVELEASRIGLAVAFGWNAVIVATDGNFAPEGWSAIDAHQPRPPRPIKPAPPRPMTDDEKRSLFSRIKNKRESS